MTRWLFLGGTGRVGAMVRRAWEHAPPAAEIVWHARGARPGHRTWPQLTDPPATLRADVVISLLGVTPATGSDMDDNRRLGLASAALARAVGASRLLMASSSAVYGGARAMPYREEDALAPLGAYGMSKARMEAEMPADLPTCLLRIGNVAGADQLLINAAKGPVSLHRFASGAGPVRSYIGPTALARTLAELAATPQLPPVLNIGAPGVVAMADLAEAAGSAITWIEAPPEAQEHIALDTSRLDALVAFGPEDSDPAHLVNDWKAHAADDPRQALR